MVLDSILEILISNPIGISLIGGLFAGEMAILSLSFLSARGFFPLGIISFFFLIGEIIADIIYFEIGRSKLFFKLKDIKRFSNIFEKVDNFVSEISKKSLFLTILYSKLVYGTRTATVIFLGIKKSDRKKFIIYDSIIMVIIVSILSAIGWFAGKGYSFLMDNLKNIQITITILVLIFIILILVRKKINIFLSTKNKKIKEWLIKRKLLR